MGPARPARPVSWSLDKALLLAMSDRFQNVKCLKDKTLVTIFLVALATGSRISELQALLRTVESIVFSDNGVTLYPNPNFLAKNEDSVLRRSPLFISSLENEEGSPHLLCPVAMLKSYLQLSSATKYFKLFVNPLDLSDLSLAKLRLYLCSFIRTADPGSVPLSHDLRKVASSFAFFIQCPLNKLKELLVESLVDSSGNII